MLNPEVKVQLWLYVIILKLMFIVLLLKGSALNYIIFFKTKRRTKQKIHTITVSGGGSQDDTICQINADIFGIPVKKIQTYETSGLGAAIATAVALNVYDSFEVATKNMVHYSKTYIPNEENHRLYNDLYHKIYKKVYPRLKKLYKVMLKLSIAMS